MEFRVLCIRETFLVLPSLIEHSDLPTYQVALSLCGGVLCIANFLELGRFEDPTHMGVTR